MEAVTVSDGGCNHLGREAGVELQGAHGAHEHSTAGLQARGAAPGTVGGEW